ncbi:hypothetical protein M434DRAFT_9820 [Hypoxylon sp. CO27-5]|nr:hypothetical protein M434DRAFT_9820 [Hypoxylon sp. CO27-5]
MDPQGDSPVRTTSDFELHASPADGSQHDHVMTVSQPSTVTESLSEVSGEDDPTARQKDVTGEGSTPAQENSNGDEAPEPVSPISREAVVVDGSSDLSAAEPPSTPLDEAMEDNPTTPQKESSNPTPMLPTPSQPDVAFHHVTTTSTEAASTLCQDNLGEGTPTAPKRPLSPTPPPQLPGNLSPGALAVRRDHVFFNVFQGLKDAWQHVIELCGRRLGSRAAFCTRFEPDIDQIRQEVMRPTATLQEIVDATELAMMRRWREQCRRFIIQYRLDMRRNLVEEAKRSAQVVKEKVLLDATQLTTTTTTPPHVPESPHPPSTSRTPLSHLPSTTPPRPSPSDRRILTPRASGNNNRGPPPSVESLRPRIERLDIEDRNNRFNDPFATPRPPRRIRLNSPERSRSRPRPSTTPRRPRRGRRTPGFRRLVQTPNPTSRVPLPNPFASQLVGHIGRHPVTTPPAPTPPSRPDAEDTPDENMSEDNVFGS